MSNNDAQSFYFIANSFHQWIIHLNSPNDAQKVAEDIKARLANSNLSVLSWQESERLLSNHAS